MRRTRCVLIVLMSMTLLGGTLTQPPVVTRAAEACFPETGHCIRGRFLDYWQQHGGLALNGYPLSDERTELLEDGKEYTVQYFERARLEYHPENAGTPYDVLLGQFGRRVLRARFPRYTASIPSEGYQGITAPVSSLPGATFFPQTGHNLSGQFREYWNLNGGLAQFGYPLTEEFEQRLENGNSYRVQYFERARLELHPENQAPYDVLLGQFGREIAAQNALLTGDFARLYLADAGVRERLGAPAQVARQVPGAVQEFEHGRMLYFGDRKTIIVLHGDPHSGDLLNFGTSPFYGDTWQEGEDPGGGPAPVPGLYYPRRGFGKLWRQQGLVGNLGYATVPDETGYTMTMQWFTGGLLLTTPDARAIYAIFTNNPCEKCALFAFYVRYDAPPR